MKKILYIVSTLKKTGPIVVLANIIKYLDRSQFEPIILTLSPEPDDSMVDYFKENLNVKVNSLSLSRIESMFSGKSKIEEYIGTNGIDIIHTHGIRADSLLKNINISNISTLHNYPYYDYLMKFGKLKGNLMLFQHMRIIKLNKESFVACSKSISKEFENNGLKLAFIENGVDLRQYKRLTTQEKSVLKEKLNFSLEKKIFISVGSLIFRKDMETVINGFKLYNKDNDAILLIAGDGPEKDKLKMISNNNIIFLGNIPNVVEYLQISDCFISASLAEGLPNTVMEAMACGLPVALSNIPSHLELFEDVDIDFFNIKDIKKLSQLLELVSSNILAYQQYSLKMVEEKFSAEVMSQKYQKVYKEKIDESI